MALIEGLGRPVPIDGVAVGDASPVPVPDGTTVVLAGNGGCVVAFIDGPGKLVPMEGADVVRPVPVPNGAVVELAGNGGCVVAFIDGPGKPVPKDGVGVVRPVPVPKGTTVELAG